MIGRSLCLLMMLLFRCTAMVESEEDDYNNDAPDTVPKMNFLRFKVGDKFSMKCNDRHVSKDDITWEFKSCRTNFRGPSCDTRNAYDLDYSEGQWKKLDYNRKRKKLEVKNATEENGGFYRCLYNDSIIKIYFIEVAMKTSYEGAPPNITSLRVLNNTTLQCYAYSRVLLEMRWLRECGGRPCEPEVQQVLYNNTYCYCVLPSEFTTLDGNNYMSKTSLKGWRRAEEDTFVCLVISRFGNVHRNVTIRGGLTYEKFYDEGPGSMALLYLVPLVLVLVPLAILLGFYRSRGKEGGRCGEQHKQLITPVPV